MVEFVEINGSSTPLTEDLLGILSEAFKRKVPSLDSANLIIQLQRKQGAFTYAIKEDGKYLGMATIVYLQKILNNSGIVGLIEDVCIDKNIRGFGYGKQLIAHLVEKAKVRKCYKVILYANSTNEKFYRKCGLRPVCDLYRMDLD